jgi:hypothetical protein
MDVLIFHKYVTVPTCQALGPKLATPDACLLVTLTGVAESGLREIDQRTGPGDATLGPGYGLFQIEVGTYNSLLKDFLRYRPALDGALRQFLAPEPSAIMQLATNLAFGAAVCRLRYYWRPEPRPGFELRAMAEYWKRFYNSAAGKGTVEGFIAKTRAAYDLLKGAPDVADA